MSGIQFVLRPFRDAAGLSQRELALRIGVAYPTVCNWENGKSNRIDFDVLGRLCTVLSKQLGERVGVEDLLRRKAGRQSAPEREVRALLAKCMDDRYALVDHHLSDAVEACERQDWWTALLHAFDAGTVNPKPSESTQQLQRLGAARNEIAHRTAGTTPDRGRGRNP